MDVRKYPVIKCLKLKKLLGLRESSLSIKGELLLQDRRQSRKKHHHEGSGKYDNFSKLGKTSSDLILIMCRFTFLPFWLLFIADQYSKR